MAFLFRSLTLTLSLLSCMQQVWATERPNIIVIFTDDHGYADLSCQKVLPDVRTPNIDAVLALVQQMGRVAGVYPTFPEPDIEDDSTAPAVD